MTHKRFVAGAICPNCKQADKTVIYDRDGFSVRECVACKHIEALDKLGAQQELPTRVNLPKNGPTTVELQPIQIINPRTTKPETGH